MGDRKKPLKNNPYLSSFSASGGNYSNAYRYNSQNTVPQRGPYSQTAPFISRPPPRQPTNNAFPPAMLSYISKSLAIVQGSQAEPLVKKYLTWKIKDCTGRFSQQLWSGMPLAHIQMKLDHRYCQLTAHEQTQTSNVSSPVPKRASKHSTVAPWRAAVARQIAEHPITERTVVSSQPNTSIDGVNVSILSKKAQRKLRKRVRREHDRDMRISLINDALRKKRCVSSNSMEVSSFSANPSNKPKDFKDPVSVAKRAARFHSSKLSGKSRAATHTYTVSRPQNIISFDGVRVQLNWDGKIIRGTSNALEKKYLRLTRAPEPSDVRPKPVLRRSLAMVMQKWKQPLGQQAPYRYVCEQLKSIRQDLKVQHIEDAFAATVYETHARIALEIGDLSEFNQCQSQLLLLHEKGVGTATRQEFFAYRLLYYTVIDAGDNLAAMLKRLACGEVSENEAIAHALAVHRAVSLGNYVRFFKLYCTAPNHNGDLMRQLFESVRFKALCAIVRAYRPTRVAVSYMTKAFLMENVAACVKFLQDCHCVLRDSSGNEVVHYTGQDLVLDTRASSTTLAPPEKTEEQYEEDIRRGISHGSFGAV